MVNLIVAYDSNFGIGLNNETHYHFGKDLRRFKEITLNKTIVIGSNTFSKLPLLKNREVIVLSNTIKTLNIEGYKLFNCVDDVIKYSEDKEVWICGGAKIYKSFMPYVQKMELTLINDASNQSDTKVDFIVEKLSKFNLISGFNEVDIDKKSGKEYEIMFRTYERK